MIRRALIVLLCCLACCFGCEHERGIIFIIDTDIRYPGVGESNPGRHRIEGIVIISRIVGGGDAGASCREYALGPGSGHLSSLPRSDLVRESRDLWDFDGELFADYTVYGCPSAARCSCPEEGADPPAEWLPLHQQPALVRGGMVLHAFLADACVEHQCPSNETCELREGHATCVDPRCVGFPCDGGRRCVADSGQPRCEAPRDAAANADASTDASLADSTAEPRDARADATFASGVSAVTPPVSVDPSDSPCALCGVVDLTPIPTPDHFPATGGRMMGGPDVSDSGPTFHPSHETPTRPLTDASVLESTSATPLKQL